jgi:AcrR family transcriptional regulator
VTESALKASPKNAKRETLRQTVLDVAAELFVTKGFLGTSLQDIADAMEIGRTGIYYYFKSKDEILARLVEQITVFTEQQSAAAIARGAGTPSEILRGMVRDHAQVMLKHAPQFRVVDRNENDLPPAIRKIHETSKRAVLENFTHVIVRGMADGSFRPGDTRVAAFAVIGMCNWSAWWYRPGGRLSPEQICEQLADMAVNSLRHPDAPRGQRESVADALRLLRHDLDALERLALPDPSIP